MDAARMTSCRIASTARTTGVFIITRRGSSIRLGSAYPVRPSRLKSGVTTTGRATASRKGCTSMSADQASARVAKRSTPVLIILLAAVVGGLISLGTIMTGGEVLRQSEAGVIIDSVGYTSAWGWLRVALVVAGCVLVALLRRLWSQCWVRVAAARARDGCSPGRTHAPAAPPDHHRIRGGPVAETPRRGDIEPPRRRRQGRPSRGTGSGDVWPGADRSGSHDPCALRPRPPLGAPDFVGLL